MSTNQFAFINFIAVTIAVAWISYFMTRKAKDKGATGYFMAGKGLTAWFIAGSMLLTNLSAEQLVGLNGAAYAGDLSTMAWESTAAVATIVLALYFLPRYLQGGFTTLPQFLEERFDKDMRRIVSFIFIMGYTLVANPSALYLGAVAINEVFAVHESLGVTRESMIWILVWSTGFIGAVYAIAGGLRAVAVSDTINGIILLVATIAVPILGLIMLGNGQLSSGLEILATKAPEKLNSVGGATSSVPFGTLFTGMIFANLFFWCTNQMIIQRTLAAKNLEEGQKGVLFTGFIKILVPFVMLIPGVIAYHLITDLPNRDLAYPALIRLVMPWWFMGFFIAAFFGAVISHFNSIVNSTATLFAYDFYQAYFPNVSDAKLIRIGKITGTLFSVVSMIIAPLLYYAPEGIYMLIRRFTGFYNIPIIAVVLAGFFFSKVSARAAKIATITHILVYAFLIFGLGIEKRWNLHFIHLMGILFILELSLMLILSQIWPRKTAYIPVWTGKEPLTPWRHAISMSIFLGALLITIYATFSSLALARSGPITAEFYILLTLIWGSCFVLMFYFSVIRFKRVYYSY